MSPARAQDQATAADQPEASNAQAAPPEGRSEGPAAIRRADETPRTPVIVQARVLRRPTAEETDGLYPEAANRASLGGKATIECKITTLQRLEACRVISETPAGYGFGEAVAKSAPFYRVSQPSVDGRLVPDAPFRLTIDFRPAPKEAPPPPPDPVGVAAGVQAPENVASASAQTPAPAPAKPAPPPVPKVRALEALWAPGLIAAAALIGMPAALLWPVRRRQRTAS